MANPWLRVPLGDYEAHMKSAAVAQYGPLADLFAAALELRRPRSVAIFGLAGGNGLERIDPNLTTRIVGVDLNPLYLEAARHRFGAALDLQLHCLDLANVAADLEPVELVHAALIFEHAGVGLCLENAIRLVAPGGALSIVLQLPGDSAPNVAATPFASIQRLAPHFVLVDPAWLRQRIETSGLCFQQESRKSLPGGKAFWMGIFARA